MYTSKQWIEKMACESWEGGGRWFMDNSGRLCNDPYDPATDLERTAFFEALEAKESRLYDEFLSAPMAASEGFDTEKEYCIWLEKVYKERYLGEDECFDSFEARRKRLEN